MHVIEVARVCHEANRELCRSHGDHSQPPWGEAPDWQRDSAIDGVMRHLRSPGMTPEQTHASWVQRKRADGWRYGPEKDPEARTHPCIAPYSSLPAEQRAKDHLFAGIVRALAGFVTDGLDPGPTVFGVDLTRAGDAGNI